MYICMFINYCKMTNWEKFCGWSLRKLGWTAVGGPAKDKVAILLGVPHTSIWDFVISYLYYRSLGQKARCLVKKELFFWPLGPILKSLGGVPVDRKNAAACVKGLIDQMKDSEEKFHLAIAPEGTRKPAKKWKTGYHTIAKAIDCPVYLAFFDWGTKRVGFTESFPIGDNAREDTERIQARYEEMHLVGRHPENYITH